MCVDMPSCVISTMRRLPRSAIRSLPGKTTPSGVRAKPAAAPGRNAERGGCDGCAEGVALGLTGGGVGVTLGDMVVRAVAAGPHETTASPSSTIAIEGRRLGIHPHGPLET